MWNYVILFSLSLYNVIPSPFIVIRWKQRASVRNIQLIKVTLSELARVQLRHQAHSVDSEQLNFDRELLNLHRSIMQAEEKKNGGRVSADLTPDMPRNTDQQKPGERWVWRWILGVGSNVDVDKVRWDSHSEASLDTLSVQTDFSLRLWGSLAVDGLQVSLSCCCCCRFLF